ncbi:hypothetical protein [Enhygromyxa salina]|uniref:Uncharacterized protein n=1 Tax=Enhygromyxa salina TaxID=215803 RepID=A0A2S9YP48_9BACT|nr:hypothetical protein [Enhygromyxa salina]PRQ06856.1 hypothetical protein ENSA7_33940 [Enhygromyxa salina]
MRPRQLVTLSVVSLLVACDSGPALPLSYETEHLRIHTDPDVPLCAGDLVAFEAIIDRIEDDLGFSIEEKVSVSIWPEEAWKNAREHYCPTDPRVIGCTSSDGTVIHTTRPALEHELAHAPIPYLAPFFAEGLADVYSGVQLTRFGFTAPADNLAISAVEVDQRTARHFVRWLRETWGTAKLGELVRLGKHADKRFADVYGLSFAEAEAMYFAEAPYGYPSLNTCDGTPLDFMDDLGGWRTDIDIDCDTGKDVHTYGTSLMVERTFVIPAAGYYSVSSNADGILLSRCATGPLEEAIRSSTFLGEDVPPSYAGEIDEEFHYYEGGSIVDLHFEAGKHEIGLGLFGYQGREVNLAIWPSLGPQPVEGKP